MTKYEKVQGVKRIAAELNDLTVDVRAIYGTSPLGGRTVLDNINACLAALKFPLIVYTDTIFTVDSHSWLLDTFGHLGLDVEYEEWYEVKSSSLKALKYDSKSGTLYAKFPNGKVYRYLRVPVAVFENVMAANSKGSAFNSMVKVPGFEFSLVPEDEIV